MLIDRTFAPNMHGLARVINERPIWSAGRTANAVARADDSDQAVEEHKIVTRGNAVRVMFQRRALIDRGLRVAASIRQSWQPHPAQECRYGRDNQGDYPAGRNSADPERMMRSAISGLGLVRSHTASRCGAVRIKDIANLKGVRENQILGYGLVIGLKGTGDSCAILPSPSSRCNRCSTTWESTCAELFASDTKRRGRGRNRRAAGFHRQGRADGCRGLIARRRDVAARRHAGHDVVDGSRRPGLCGRAGAIASPDIPSRAMRKPDSRCRHHGPHSKRRR